MTPVQSELFRFISGYIERHGYSPTWAEMRSATGKGNTTLRHAIRVLAKIRKISWHKGHWRGIEVRDGSADKKED